MFYTHIKRSGKVIYVILSICPCNDAILRARHIETLDTVKEQLDTVDTIYVINTALTV